jgi:hypothetical protein
MCFGLSFVTNKQLLQRLYFDAMLALCMHFAPLCGLSHDVVVLALGMALMCQLFCIMAIFFSFRLLLPPHFTRTHSLLSSEVFFF